MSRQYVEHRDGGYWVAGTRVSLDSIVYAFLEGQTAETIAQAFPVLSLEQTYGSIAFYLANRPAVDAYLAGSRDEYEARWRVARSADPMFYSKLADAKHQPQAIRS
ncbi:MAG TPA: DUF433 domain-containing protein [Candidatus Anammoximicrobium sp.]|nr:DUF433 domain-containing protein [Candidatus Anammoximicrobium sp.]